MDTPKIVELKHPIDVEGAGGAKTQITSVELRRMKAKDFQYLPDCMYDGDAAGSVKIKPQELLPLIASITGLTKEQADDIDAEDLIRLVGELSNFLSGFLGTGEKSSGGSQPPTTSRRQK